MILYFRLYEYFAGMALEQRANVLVEALVWTDANIPMRNRSLMKEFAAKGNSERANIREPSTVKTTAMSTCQLLRIMNIDLGGGADDIQETATWAIIMIWWSEYQQGAGGDLRLLDKVCRHYYALLMARFYFSSLLKIQLWPLIRPISDPFFQF